MLISVPVCNMDGREKCTIQIQLLKKYQKYYYYILVIPNLGSGLSLMALLILSPREISSKSNTFGQQFH